MPTSIGTLTAHIGVDTTALALAQRQMTMFSTRATAAITPLTKAVAGLGVVIGTVAVAAQALSVITVGKDFEKQMAVVKGVTKATEKQFDALTAKARLMGETTEFSATQAASSLRFLAMAGFSAENAIKALPGTLDLATAGNIDLGRAADIATNALTAMRLPVEQLTRVNDVFVETITSSNTNMEMMAESFKFAAPQAAAFGISIEQVSAMIGLLGNAGIQGSMAGTQLSFAFQKAHKAFEFYGVSAKRADGTTKTFIDALKLLEAQSAMAADQTEFAGQVMEIFGQRSGRAVNALLGQGVPALEAFIRQLEGAAGAADALAATMRDTLENDIKIFKSLVESVKIDIFERYGESLRRNLKAAAKFIDDHRETIVGLTMAMVSLTKQAIIMGTLLAGTIIFANLATAITLVTGAVTALTTAILLNPILAGIIVATGVLAYLIDIGSKTQNIVEGTKEWNDEVERIKNNTSSIEEFNEQLLELEKTANKGLNQTSWLYQLKFWTGGIALESWFNESVMPVLKKLDESKVIDLGIETKSLPDQLDIVQGQIDHWRDNNTTVGGWLSSFFYGKDLNIK